MRERERESEGGRERGREGGEGGKRPLTVAIADPIHRKRSRRCTEAAMRNEQQHPNETLGDVRVLKRPDSDCQHRLLGIVDRGLSFVLDVRVSSLI